ncbi:copper resistance protein NlpE N-terminal domain-containing protein [Negadavirga shengliensis]|uniref:Copper resistance protein NlpE N-terminal domain-containing protein n=1 Tax=Negadavirga shengliensis TaxID=1389218 RepID=A0ABV9T0Q8_9BACT
MKGVILIFLAGCVLWGCQTQSAVTYDGHTSANSLDWEGYYKGTLPCADCEGIATVIRLDREQTYSIQTQYLGKSDQTYTSEGTFEWNEGGSIITLSGMENGPNQYQVGENRLFQLDKKGSRITGPLADKYILEKTSDIKNDPLTNVKWILKDLAGKYTDQSKHGIYIQFDADENRVSGFGGCNQFFGQYEQKEGNKLEFERLVRTQKLCWGLGDLEDRVFQMLEMTDNYTIEEGILTMKSMEMEVLLRWTAEE